MYLEYITLKPYCNALLQFVGRILSLGAHSCTLPPKFFKVFFASSQTFKVFSIKECQCIIIDSTQNDILCINYQVPPIPEPSVSSKHFLASWKYFRKLKNVLTVEDVFSSFSIVKSCYLKSELVFQKRSELQKLFDKKPFWAWQMAQILYK